MKKRRDGWQKDTELWEEFWSAIQSQFGERTTSSAATPTFDFQPSLTTSSMSAETTVLVTMPATTIYVSTTIISTNFVTVPGVTVTPQLGTAASTGGFPLHQNSTWSTILRPTLTTSSSSTSRFFSSTATSETLSSPAATTSSVSSANTTTDSMIGAQSDDESKKHAIIGGLSGSIAGLVLIGLLICLALRIRRKRNEPKECDDSWSEKGLGLGLRPALIRKWTQLTGGGIGSPKQDHAADRVASPAAVDEDHRIIRMNTRHWPRPFAAGTGEGYRESQPQGTLRVVNPDPSRPETPDTAMSHFMKQRPSLAGFVFGVPKQTPDVRLQQAAQRPIPTIQVIDPNLSRECVATYERTPSFKSYPPSVASGPVVTQKPPEDPFVTVPAPIATAGRRYGEQPQATPRPRRPSISASHSTTKTTWTQHLLHPFTKRSSNAEPVQNVRGLSHFSVSSSASRSSRRSDPFDLSIRGSQVPPRGANEFRRGSPNPNWILYEGT